MENDLTLRAKLDKIPQLSATPEPSDIAKLILEVEETMAKLSTEAMSPQEKLLLLVRKLHPKTFGELRADCHYKHRVTDYESLKEALLEKSLEDWLEKHLFMQKKQLLQPMVETPNQPGQPSQPTIANPKGGRGKGKGKGQGKGKGKGQGAPQRKGVP